MKYILILLFCCALAVPSGAQEKTEKKQLGIDVGAELLSRYMWRGYDLNHKYGVLQPSVTYSPPFARGLSAGIWMSFGLAKKKSMGDKKSEIDEIDWTLCYEFDIIRERLNLQLAFQRYDFLSRWASQQKTNNRDYEISATASVFIHEMAVPYIQFSRGLDNGIRGNYFEFGVGGVYQFNKDINIGPTVATAVSNQFGQDNRLTHLAILFPLTYTIEKVDFVPSLSLHWRFRDMANDALNRKGMIVHAGIQASYRF